MTAVATRWANEPFVMGTPAQFRELREWLTEVGYIESELLAKANVRTLAHLQSLESGRQPFGKPTDPQSVLVQLYLDGERLPWGLVESVLTPPGLARLTDLGLLQPAVADPALAAGSVCLFPAENLFVVSDRLSNMETIGTGLPTDLVYSPLTNETVQFIRMLPRRPCDDFLEMCGGTGIAALVAAKNFAKRAWSADITERSTRFAAFNGVLNGLENFEAVQGDLYEPVAGRTFDVIAAHPPYVPASNNEMVFRDGGEDGEQITRRLLAGLHQCLRPGGLFYLDCVMTERTGDSIEQRIRRMLGRTEGEFDVLVGRVGTIDPRVYHAVRLETKRMTPDAFFRETTYFKEAGIEQFVAVSVHVQRRTSQRPVVTRQRKLSEGTQPEHMRWMLDYLTGTVEWDDVDTLRLLDSRPRTLPSTMLNVRSVFNDGAWNQLDARIGTATPFSVESPCPAFLPTLLARCDGQTTAREHLVRLRTEGLVSDDKSDDDFAQLLRELAEAPYIELDLFPLPSPAHVSASQESETKKG
jgi:SAM-dependent methyltransferase